MAYLQHTNFSTNVLLKKRAISGVGVSALPLSLPRVRTIVGLAGERALSQRLYSKELNFFPKRRSYSTIPKKVTFPIPRSSSPSNSGGSKDEPSDDAKTPFGYSRKDVLLIGLGVTLAGIGLKSGLEFLGVDPLQAGNVVQLVLVLGLTVGWISTYIFRVSNKEMTYAQQLRDYENKVMEKRLEGLSEAELEALLEQVEEEKRRLDSFGEQVN